MSDERQHLRRLSAWRCAMAVAWHRGEDACSGLYLPSWRRSATDAVLATPEETRRLLTAIQGKRRVVLCGTPEEVQLRAVLQPIAGNWWKELAEHVVPMQALPDTPTLRLILERLDKHWRETVEWRAMYEHLAGCDSWLHECAAES